jgi:hypothetical protein
LLPPLSVGHPHAAVQDAGSFAETANLLFVARVAGDHLYAGRHIRPAAATDRAHSYPLSDQLSNKFHPYRTVGTKDDVHFRTVHFPPSK